MKRWIALMLISVFFAAFCMVGCDDGKATQTATSDESPAAAAEEPTEEPLVTYDIQTKFAVLKYPERWKDSVSVSIDDGEPYTVSFLLNDIRVFDLLFNSEEGDILGTLDNGTEKVLLSVKCVHVKSQRIIRATAICRRI